MRLIDADALNSDDIPCYYGSSCYTEDVEEWLNDATTIDAVPVVRCKDCKYFQDNNSGYPHDECRWGKGETPDPDDFCSYGERKGGDGR